MKLIGLTGGIGSGKSTVASLFEKLGFLIVDADQIARTVRKPGGAAQKEILARFNTDDRATLRKIISESPDAKAELEAILHPLIKDESDREIARLKESNPKAPGLIYEATLLLEAGRAKDFDYILVVTAPLADRIARITARDQISPQAAIDLLNTQNSDEFRLAQSNFSIENSGDKEALEEKVKTIFKQIISDQITQNSKK